MTQIILRDVQSARFRVQHDARVTIDGSSYRLLSTTNCGVVLVSLDDGAQTHFTDVALFKFFEAGRLALQQHYFTRSSHARRDRGERTRGLGNAHPRAGKQGAKRLRHRAAHAFDRNRRAG